MGKVREFCQSGKVGTMTLYNFSKHFIRLIVETIVNSNSLCLLECWCGCVFVCVQCTTSCFNRHSCSHYTHSSFVRKPVFGW